MASRKQKRKAKRREEYLQNQDDELESSRIRYDADAEQRRASARDMYRANLVSYPDPSTSQLRMDYITATRDCKQMEC